MYNKKSVYSSLFAKVKKTSANTIEVIYGINDAIRYF